MAAKTIASRRQADADRRDDLLRRVLPKRSRDSEAIRPALVALWSALRQRETDKRDRKINVKLAREINAEVDAAMKIIVQILDTVCRGPVKTHPKRVLKKG